MRTVVFMVSLMLCFEAFAGAMPEKFQNSIFNNMLYSGGKKVFSHDIKITPTFIKDYDDKDSDAECEYISESEKAILLKCNEPKVLLKKDFWTYALFFVKYKDEWFNGEKECNVWRCLIILDENKMPQKDQNTRPSLYVSKTFYPFDEIKYHELDYKEREINCKEEFESRNWQKYIPGNWEDIRWY